jgi:hypothetical protein
MDKNKLLRILMDTYYPDWFKQLIRDFNHRHGGDNKSAKDILVTAQVEPSDLMGVDYLEGEIIRGLVKHVVPD